MMLVDKETGSVASDTWLQTDARFFILSNKIKNGYLEVLDSIQQNSFCSLSHKSLRYSFL